MKSKLLTGNAIRSSHIRPKFLGLSIIAGTVILQGCPFDPNGIPGTTPYEQNHWLVAEDVGKFAAYHGVTCALENGDHPIKIIESLPFPSYISNATVVLNGWDLSYREKDHHVLGLGGAIYDIQFTADTGGAKSLSWEAIGALSDSNFDDGYSFCYRYTAFGWNEAELDITVDDDDTGNDFVNTNNSNDTALKTISGFIENSAFDPSDEVAVLPRGFVLAWGKGNELIDFIDDILRGSESAFSPKTALALLADPRLVDLETDRAERNDTAEVDQDSATLLFGPSDHHILQLAHNRRMTENFVYAGKRYDGEFRPNLPSNLRRGGLAYGGFVSWETQTILKDNDTRRDYAAGELVSALGGADIKYLEPPFNVLPREDSSFCGTVSAKTITETHEIRNIPYEYAIPVLTGWDIGYLCKDHHITKAGISILDFEYTKQPGQSTGTLVYTVESIVNDKDFQHANYMNHAISILGVVGDPPQ